MAPSRLSCFAVLLALAAFDRSAEGFSFVQRKSIPPSQRSLGGRVTDPTATATLSSSAATRRIRTGSGSLHMYLPPQTSTQTAPMVAQRILKAPSAHTGRKSIRPTTSSSVLAASDTLPCFPTAHGLLSPEIVQRMQEMTASATSSRSAPLVRFLDTYRNDGPMACLPMLADPCVLPKLTEAMRDLA
mmetsp:Transcript_2104/g.4712  ORF Transcript_2104/g.4712 Transcript_2104/m.4712 type:complete len:187 (-) Transcript_2104:461-1021(-)